MDIARLIKKAKLNYSTNSLIYDKYLDIKNIYSLNDLQNKYDFLQNSPSNSNYSPLNSNNQNKSINSNLNDENNFSNNSSASNLSDKNNMSFEEMKNKLKNDIFDELKDSDDYKRLLNNSQNNMSNRNFSSMMQTPTFVMPSNFSNGGGINVISKNYINPDVLMNKNSMEEKLETKSISLAKIPDNLIKKTKTDWEPINFRGIDVDYELYGLSRVLIKFNDHYQKLVYEIIEPQLSSEELGILEELKKGFIYVFEKFSPQALDVSGKELIIHGTKKLCLKYSIKLSDEQFKKITYYLERDFLGLDMIEPIMHDPYIEDISCDGLNIPIFVNHLKFGAIETNISYKEVNKLNSFIVKLAQKSNQEVSLSKPILQGALPDGSRLEAIYGKEVSEKGSSYTIRKFREEPFTPVHLIDFGTMPPFLLAYLWLAVEYKQSIMVSGGTATGKTTILNALSLFVPPASKIVSIEDTPEINLPHEHWLPMIAREGKGKSEVSMFDLLKASLRERPDYIIVGEIRGVEAAILFQGMATGHAGLGTFHAEKFEDLVNRMIIEPINLPKQLITELSIILFMKQVKVKNNLVRRVNSVVEVIDYNTKADKFTTNEFVSHSPIDDTFSFKEKSRVISHLLEIRGGSEDSLWKEIEKRRRILDTMHKEKFLEFNYVNKIIKAYYKNPSEIFEYIENLKIEMRNEKNEE